MTALLEDIGNELNLLNRTASSSFRNAIDRAGAWEDRVIDNFGSSINYRWNIWLSDRPILTWLVHHPLVSLVLGVVATVLIIRLLVTIYRAIASAIDRMWLWILRSPVLLLKFLFGWEVKPKTTVANAMITNYEVTNNPEQLEQIMTAIEQIQQQQQQIIEELQQLKGRSPFDDETSPYIETKQINFKLPTSEK